MLKIRFAVFIKLFAIFGLISFFIVSMMTEDKVLAAGYHAVDRNAKERLQFSASAGILAGEKYVPAPRMVCAEDESLSGLSPTEMLEKTGYYGVINPQPQKTEYKKNYYPSAVISTAEDAIKAIATGFGRCATEIRIMVRGDYSGKIKEEFSEKIFSSGISGDHTNWYQYSVDHNQYTDISTIYIIPVYKESWKAVTLLKNSAYPADEGVEELLSIAQGIVDEAVAKSSDIRLQILYINNKICSMAVYDHESMLKSAALNEDTVYTVDDEYKIVPAHDATGVLLEGKGVCDSYAAAFELCLNILGVDNYIVISSGGGHCWNRVKIDGEWLNVDVTWNDGTYGRINNDYFLLNDADFIAKTKKKSARVISHTPYDDQIPDFNK